MTETVKASQLKNTSLAFEDISIDLVAWRSINTRLDEVSVNSACVEGRGGTWRWAMCCANIQCLAFQCGCGSKSMED